MKQYYLLLITIFLSCLGFAHTGKDSLLVKKVKPHVSKIDSAALARLQAINNSKRVLGIENSKEMSAQFRSFPELDKQLPKGESFNFAYSNYEPEFNSKFIEDNFSTGPKADSLQSTAKKVLDKLEELENFVDILTGTSLLELPVGLKKKDSTSGNEVVIAVSEVKFHPQYAELKMWAKLTIPNREKVLYFGAENIKLSHDGALIGDARLVLLGDVPIPFNGDNWLLTLMGGIDLNKGVFDDTSYIEIDCSGLKAISLEGNVKISRKVLLPVKEDGTYLCGAENIPFNGNEEVKTNVDCYVQSNFSVKAAGWNDVLIDVTIPDFEVVGFKGWAFHVENTVLDLSDTKNASGMVFPQEYNTLTQQGDSNLWRGIYAGEVSVMLPQGFQNKNTTNKRVKFGAQHLILDSYGVSGNFYATNILQKEEGSAGKWAFSIDSIGINLAVNTLKGGTMSGGVQVPIVDEPLGYKGWVTPNEFGLGVSLQEDYEAPVFSGTIHLEPNSVVGIKVKADKVYPFANLTGSLSVSGQFDVGIIDPLDSKKDFDFKGITFQELELQTDPNYPFIQAKYFGLSTNIKIFSFPAVISEMGLVTPNKEEVGLSFSLSINLDENIAVSSDLQILGKLETGASIHKWKFDRIKFTPPKLDNTNNGFALKASLKILRNDPVYGDAFIGEVTVGLEKLKLTLDGRAMFGAKDFRYWFVDVWSNKAENNSGGKLMIKSFYGGISNRMRRQVGGGDNFAPSGTKYFPEEKLGLGLRAGVKLGAPNPGTFSGNAFLEMEFNSNGGLNRIGFTGYGSFMSKGGDFASTDTGGAGFGGLEGGILKDIGEFTDKYTDKAANLTKNGNFLGLSKEALGKDKVIKNGKISVYLGIEKDFTTNTFHGEFELYIDLAGIRGTGPNKRAGWAVLHSSPDEWYLHVGSPDDRLGLLFAVGPEEFEVGGYFMTGDRLPDQVAPHPRVLQILGDDILNTNRKESTLKAGRGFAFGLNFTYRKNFNYLIFYAFVEAGAGFDVMHAYYDNAKCKGRSGPVGNDGWYSMGQVYAYLYGEFGVRVKLPFIKGKYPIAQAGIAALLRGQFPNPAYFEGYVGMYYSILGGLVKGRMRLKVEFGEECIMENIAEAVGVPIIADVTPNSDAKDVDVFTAPQAVFNYAVENDFVVDIEGKVKTFRIKLQNFKLTYEGKEIPGDLEWNNHKDMVTLLPKEVLPSQKPIKLLVEVSFEEKTGASYTTLTENGQLVTEKREYTFTTDIAPDHIPVTNIAYMYPVKDQKNFYPEEFERGYIKLKQGQPYLFDAGYQIKAEVTGSNSLRKRTNLKYDRSQSMIHFDMPQMDTETPYIFNVMAFPSNANIEPEIIIEESTTVFDEGGDTSWYDPVNSSTATSNQSANVTISTKKASSGKISNAAPKSLLEFEFRSSMHKTFKNKMNSLVVTGNITDIVQADIHTIHLKLNKYENFDEVELLGTKFTGNMPLVYAEAILTDSYYRQQIKPLLYDNYPLNGTLRVNRDEGVLGVPPVRGMDIPDWYEFYLINQPNSDYVTTRYPVMYNLPYYYRSDYDHLQFMAANYYFRTLNVTHEMYDRVKYLLSTSFPAIPLGKYKTKLIYQTPGKVHIDSKQEIKFVND